MTQSEPATFRDLESGARALAFHVKAWMNVYAHKRTVILIAGPTASGKSTLTERLFGANPSMVTVLNLDRYYLDERDVEKVNGLTNWDTPGAMDIARMRTDIESFLYAPDGGTFSVPVYEMRENRRVGEELLEAKNVLIVEGMYAIDHVPMNTPFRAFVDAPMDTLLRRKLIRDVEERNKREEEVRKHFTNNVIPGIARYVAPQKSMATFLIENG